MNTRGFPHCPPAKSQIGNYLFKTSVISTEYCCLDGPFKKYHLDIFSLVVVCLYPRECNQLISKKTIVIEMMCKLPLIFLSPSIDCLYKLHTGCLLCRSTKCLM